MSIKNIFPALLASLTLGLAPCAFATFHFAQVQKVIAGIDGDSSAQAIQLRIRLDDQEEFSQARLRAWDATGQNPVLLVDIQTDIANGDRGDTVVLATPAFTAFMKTINPAFEPDFPLTNPIPQEYLAAGRLTFERDDGVIFWSFAWGGENYTGPNNGSTDNDANGFYGPAFPRALTPNARRAVVFTRNTEAPSRSNALDYRFSRPSESISLRLNDGTRFVLSSLAEIAVFRGNRELASNQGSTNFGNLVIGETSSPRRFVIRNVGSAPLTGLRIREKDRRNNFRVSSLSRSSIAPGQSLTFTVKFRPTRFGTRSATLLIDSNDKDESPFRVRLVGHSELPF